MTRFLVLLAVALLIAYLVAKGARLLRARLAELLDAGPYTRAGGRRGRGSSGGELVACAGCGLHVVGSRAIVEPAPRRAAAPGEIAGRVFCSEACRRRAAMAS